MSTNRLTDAAVKATFRTIASTGEPLRLADGNGLALELRPDGTGLWRYRYRWEGRQQTLSCGMWPYVSLAQARAVRERMRTQLASGQNPSHVRRSSRQKSVVPAEETFEVVARQWHESRKNLWTANHSDQVIVSLERNVFPTLGKSRIGEIFPKHVLDTLQPMIDRGALELAARVRQRVGEVFDYASAVRGLDSVNDLRGNPALAIRKRMPPPPKRHYPSLAPAELPLLLDAIHHYTGRPETRLGLLLLMHFFVRPGELRAARWQEFDFHTMTWRIPATRMKMKRVHLVPLVPETIALLRELHTVTGESVFLFPGVRRSTTFISETTFGMALKHMGFRGRQVAHGFRSIASTWLNESGGFNPDVIERQLAHEPANEVRSAYNRAEYLDERRRMMGVWAEHLGQFLPELLTPRMPRVSPLSAGGPESVRNDEADDVREGVANANEFISDQWKPVGAASSVLGGAKPPQNIKQATDERISPASEGQRGKTQTD